MLRRSSRHVFEHGIINQLEYNPLKIRDHNCSLTTEWEAARSGTDRHRHAVINGIDRGIAVLNIRVVIQWGCGL